MIGKRGAGFADGTSSRDHPCYPAIKKDSSATLCTRAARTIFVADTHHDGQRFIVRPDEKLTGFVELEATLGVAANCLDWLV